MTKNSKIHDISPVWDEGSGSNTPPHQDSDSSSDSSTLSSYSAISQPPPPPPPSSLHLQGNEFGEGRQPSRFEDSSSSSMHQYSGSSSVQLKGNEDMRLVNVLLKGKARGLILIQRETLDSVAMIRGSGFIQWLVILLSF